MSEIENLTDKDFKVLNYIKENPGTSKEGVVRGLKGEPSRITVLNILTKLKGYGMIIERKDKPNSQLIHLYINHENLLVSVSNELDELRQAVFSFLEKWKAKYAKRRSAVEEAELLNSILLIYRHLTAMYNLYLSLLWPKKVSDPVILNNLYRIIFTKLPEIISKLSEVFHLTMKEEFVNSLLPSMIDNSFFLMPKLMESITEVYRKYGLRREGEAMFDAVWKISSEAYSLSTVSFTAIRRPKMDLNKWTEITGKDWRKLIRYRSINRRAK